MIKLEGVSFDYPNKKGVLKDINVEIEDNSFVSIVGQNGSGKSTLAKLLNALLVPSAGSVAVDGFLSTDEENIWEIRKRVGMVFQNPDNQMVATIVEEDVAFGPENLGISRDEIRKRIDDSLEAVGMSEFMRKPPHKLSGGQKQRVAIAGILAMRPKTIIFDESTSMLDPKGKQEVMQSMINLHKQGITVIHITHSMKEVLSSERVIALEKGEVVCDMNPRDFFSNDEIQKRLDFDLPLTVRMSLLTREQIPEFPMCFTDDEYVEAICPYL